MKRIILIILILFLAISCKDERLGQTLPPANYPQFSRGLEGHHSLIFEGNKVTLDYDWHTNEERNHIWLDGTFEINTPDWKYLINSYYKEATIVFKVLHMDQNYKIIGTNQIFIPIDNSSTVKDYKFKRDFPYKDEYKYVSYGIEARGIFY